VKNATLDYRSSYRHEHIGRRYNGWLHLAFTVSMSCVLILACASQVAQVASWEWATIPLTFLYVNLAEYLGHRYIMHRRRPGLGLVYERHTCQHHIFFTDQHMEFDSTRDFKVVLFPPVLVTFFLLAFGTPIVLLLGWIATPNVAFLFGATAVSYFLNYELLHFAYHLPRNHWIARLPGMAALRRLHTYHHDQGLMSTHNFNITYPIADALFGTLKRD
jgi:hypothetical protein